MLSHIIRTLCCRSSNSVVAISTLPIFITQNPSSESLSTDSFMIDTKISQPSIMDYLDEVEYTDTIPFIPEISSGKVIKVYDGDTITIASKMPYPDSPIFRFSVRLTGIDSPEIKTKFAAEKTLATQSKDALSEKILGKKVILKNVSLEKYGRLLADVYLDDLNLNQWMLDNKYAVAYDGGTKNRPDDWIQEPTVPCTNLPFTKTCV